MAFSFELKLAFSPERYGAISVGPEHRPGAADAAPGREAFLLAEMGDGAQKLCASEHLLRPFVR